MCKISSKIFSTIILLISSISLFAQEIKVKDDFEGQGTISTWYGDDCGIDTEYKNPYKSGINTSETVLKYSDNGSQYANIGFNLSDNFDLEKEPRFSLLIYIESSSLTGTQNNQVSLKLQNGTLAAPWSTQTEIIKTVELDKWQKVEFDFENDNFINLDASSPDPVDRNDLNRVVLQVNGENNNDKVIAFIDDFEYKSTVGSDKDPDHQGYTYLVWSDEFEGDGAIDSDKWHHQTKLPNGNSWFNGELQHYTNRQENSFQKDGFLHLVAKKEKFNDQGVTKDFTSARLNSKFAFTYGRVEVRAKLPEGSGTWPALWFLGKNIRENGGYFYDDYGTTSWPACGEIDMMEHWGTNQNFVQSAIHTPSSNGNTVNKGGVVANSVSDVFHTYGMIWTEEKIDFIVDGSVIYTYDPENKNADTWPFDTDQYMLINTAIIGGIPNNFSESPFIIDYVRIYSNEDPTATEEPSHDGFELYPNPSTSSINLSYYSLSSYYSYQLIDQLGRVLVENYTNKHQVEIDISDLEKGIYRIVILNEDETLIKSFIKQE